MDSGRVKSGKQRRMRATGVMIEALEPRQLLSASLQDSELLVTGTGRSDRISIWAKGGATPRYFVSINGRKRCFSQAEIKSIQIMGGPGNDRIAVGVKGEPVDARFKVEGGEGANRLLGLAASVPEGQWSKDDGILPPPPVEEALPGVPTIGSLSVGPNPAIYGQMITLSANSVLDSDGSVTKVSFYRESNGKSGLQTGSGGDLLLGTDTVYPFAHTQSTDRLAVGVHTYYAQAVDNAGNLSRVAAVAHTLRGPLPAVSLTVSDASASEPGKDTGAFLISRTGSKAEPLTVYYTIGGTAVMGTDYQAITESVVIPAGSSTATVRIKALDDLACEDVETVVLTLRFDANYTVATFAPVPLGIVDNDPPEVTIEVADDVAGEEDHDTGTFIVTRTGPTKTLLTVYYTIAGTATNAGDYSWLSGSIDIPVGTNSVPLVIVPLADSVQEGDESVVVSITTRKDYVIGAEVVAQITIADSGSNHEDPDSPPHHEPQSANFQVFDGTCFVNKPDDLYDRGISPIYMSYFDVYAGTWPDLDMTQPDEAATRALARKVAATGQILVLDIEHWAMDIRSTPMEEANENLAKFIQIVDWIKDERPTVQVGFFSIVPQGEYWNSWEYGTALKKTGTTPWWTARLPEFEAEYRELQAANDWLMPLAEKVDMVFPSLYTFYEDREGWRTVAEMRIAEARRFNKPVVPFLWMEYHEGGSARKYGKDIPADYWRMQLDTVRELADGMVIWGGYNIESTRQSYYQEWDNTAAWWIETKDFLEPVIDNTNTSAFQVSGGWSTSTRTAGYLGANYLEDGNTDKGTKTAAFSTSLVPGAYEVFARWTSGSNRASNVPIEIMHEGGATTVFVDQRRDGGVWMSLGVYEFDGVSDSVIFRTEGTTGYVIVDAVKFVRA